MDFASWGLPVRSSLRKVIRVIAVFNERFRVGGIGFYFPASEVSLAQGASEKHAISAGLSSLEAFLDWLDPLVVVIVIGGMIYALVGAMLAPAD
jgi:membrane protein required for beta-lactamase induction